MFSISRRWAMGAVGAVCLLLVLPGRSFAGQGHTGYSRAMDDLRLAHALLQRPNGMQAATSSPDEVSIALGHLDSAMKELDQAVGSEPSKVREVSKIDAHMPWAERLDQSLRLLDRAEMECAREKDDSGNAKLKARIFDLLDQAHTRLSVALQTVNFDYGARNIPTRND